VNGNVSGTGGVVYQSGVVTMNGTNTYNGGSSVSANATLVLGPNGSLATSITLLASTSVFNVVGVIGGSNGTGPGGSYALNPNTTLTGPGTVVGSIQVGGGASLIPGGPTNFGTLHHAGGTMTWAPGGKLVVGYNPTIPTPLPPGQYDTVASTGTLNVSATSASKFEINLREVIPLPGTITPSSQQIVVASFSGPPTFAGSDFNALFSLTGAYSAPTPVVSISGNDVVLTFVTALEPVTVFGFASGLVGVIGLCRRFRSSMGTG
jgi:hypothetical protein